MIELKLTFSTSVMRELCGYEANITPDLLTRTITNLIDEEGSGLRGIKQPFNVVQLITNKIGNSTAILVATDEAVSEIRQTPESLPAYVQDVLDEGYSTQSSHGRNAPKDWIKVEAYTPS